MNSYQLRVVSREENSRFRRIRSTRSDSLISSACFSASLTCKYPCVCVKMNKRFQKNELDFWWKWCVKQMMWKTEKGIVCENVLCVVTIFLKMINSIFISQLSPCRGQEHSHFLLKNDHILFIIENESQSYTNTDIDFHTDTTTTTDF